MAGLSPHTTAALYRLLRAGMAELARAGCPFHGRGEVDESSFGPTRVRCARGRGAGRETPVSGILERGGRVHCQIVRNWSKTTLGAVMGGRVSLRAEISTDGFAGYDGPVEAGFAKHHRINRYAEPMLTERRRLRLEAYDLHEPPCRGAMELAQAGSDDGEIMSCSGHVTKAMVRKHAGEARQIVRARQARKKRQRAEQSRNRPVITGVITA